jgi:hypothetical protein
MCAPAEGFAGAFDVPCGRISEWIVPPVIIPLFLLLLVFAAAIFNG